MPSDTPDPSHLPAIPALSVSPLADLRLTTGISPPLALGDLGSLGRFRVLSSLGTGGMGIVLLCKDTTSVGDSPSLIAAKVLRLELRDNPTARHRFLTEARHMSRLVHPHIVPVEGIFPDHDPVFYTMPYYAKGSLGRAFCHGSPLPAPRIHAIALAVASALQHAHDRGIIHRDLKPANILLTETDQAVVCDFGLVRTVFNDTLVDPSRSVHEGSAPYMSPALANGQAEDTRCDIYAFGATLYELLTTQPPYDGISPAEILTKIRTGPPTPILELQPAAHPGLAAVAERCMAREHRDRYASMADVLTDLDRIDPLKPHPISTRAHLHFRTRLRQPRIAVPLALLLISLFLTAYFVFRPPAHRAYLGKPQEISYVEASHFDTGPAGVDYHDLDPQNFGSSTLRDTGVDLWIDPANPTQPPRVGRTMNGEWLAYSVFVPDDEPRYFYIHTVGTGPDGEIRVDIDGETVVPALAIPDPKREMTHQRTYHNQPIRLKPGIRRVVLHVTRTTLEVIPNRGSLMDIRLFGFERGRNRAEPTTQPR